jgi:hypothetical protein
MVDAIVTGFVAVFVILAVFAVLASLLTLYVWRADPYHFALWRAALRSKREGRDASTRRSAGSAWPGTRNLRARSLGGFRSGVVSRSVPPVAPMPPVTTSGKSAAARLQYWLEMGRYRR